MAAYVPIFFLIQAVCVACVFYPWRLSWPYARLLLHLPLALIPLWLIYESVMPQGMNIRVDLLFLCMEFAVVGVIYVIRISVLKRHARENKSDESSSRQQTAVAVGGKQDVIAQ